MEFFFRSKFSYFLFSRLDGLKRSEMRLDLVLRGSLVSNETGWKEDEENNNKKILTKSKLSWFRKPLLLSCY